MKKVVLMMCFILFLSGLGLFLVPQPEEDWERRPVELKDFGGFYYAYMDFNGPYSLLTEKKKVFKEEFAKQGIKATGPLFITFYNPPSIYKGDELRWAPSYPVDKSTKVKAPLKKRQAEKVKAVILLHLGPWKEIKESFDRVQNYIKEHKYEKLWPAYEIYHQDPFAIEVIHPVKK